MEVAVSRRKPGIRSRRFDSEAGRSRLTTPLHLEPQDYAMLTDEQVRSLGEDFRALFADEVAWGATH
jgi:hypothetical protein